MVPFALGVFPGPGVVVLERDRYGGERGCLVRKSGGLDVGIGSSGVATEVVTGESGGIRMSDRLGFIPAVDGAEDDITKRSVVGVVNVGRADDVPFDRATMSLCVRASTQQYAISQVLFQPRHRHHIHTERTNLG